MHRLFLIALLAIAACHGTPSSTTPPSNQATAVVDVPLSNDALVGFVKQRFPEAVKAGTFKLDWGSGGQDNQLIEELQLMGITTTGQLAAIVPPDYSTKGVAAVAADDDASTTIPGLIRDLLIIHDTRGYFEKAWRSNWSASGPGDFPAPAAYGVDFGVMQELDVYVEDGEGYGEEDYGDPCGGDPCGGDPCGD